MQVLITLSKILLLLTFAVIAFGWGACGGLGLAVTLDSSRIEWGIVGLSLGGFALMGLFGWGTWRMYRAFFPKTPDDGQGWVGLYPVISDPHTAVTLHAALEWLGVAAGAGYYRALRRRADGGSLLEGSSFAVLAGCLLGAALGNKAVFWLEMPQRWPAHGGLFGFFGGGQSMVGGLLGGLIGVESAKKLVGLRHSTGDFFVFPILLGLMIGRLGCFLAGLHDDTYGLPTVLPWGVDFGDGLSRHPAQLYEIGFAAGLWLVLLRLREHCAAESGLLFKLMLSAYLLWRLAVDGLKPVPYVYPLGLSGIQWICAAALLAYGPHTYRQWKRLP